MWTGIDYHFSIDKHFFIQDTPSNSANVSICHWFYLLEPWLLFAPFPGLHGANGGDSLVLSADTSDLEADTLMQNCTQEKMTKKKSIQMLEISNCLWFDRLSSGHFCHLVSALERHISRYWRWQELQQPLQVAKILFIYLFILPESRGKPGNSWLQPFWLFSKHTVPQQHWDLP